MDKITYGLDLPEEITDKNDEIAMEMFGITQEYLDSIDIEIE